MPSAKQKSRKAARHSTPHEAATALSRREHREELLQRLAAVVRSSDDAIFSLTNEGLIKSWNPAAQQVFGHLPEQVIDHHFRMLFPADHQGEAEEILRRIHIGEHVSRYETISVRRDHRQVSVALTISPIQTRGAGRIVGASIIARDITDQKTAEEKLRISEAFYHSLVENLPQNIFRKELDLRFSFANQRFCQLLGRSLAEVVGKSDYDFYPPDLAAKYQEDDRRVIAGGEPFETVEMNQPPGGRKLYVHVCKTPIRDLAGRIIGIQCIFWDITASREAEEALRLGEERYRTLLNSVTDYIYTVELKDGKPVATRHGPGCLAVTGYSPEDYENANYLWYLMIHPEDREAVLGQLKRVQDGHAEPLEHRIIHRDGSVRWVRNTPVPRMDREGHLLAYDGLISDITERKLAEEKLKQANTELSAKHAELTKTLKDLTETRNLLIEAEKLEMVGQLAAGVAHEVKNPLAIILSGIEFLVQLPMAADATSKLVLKDMREALGRADGVIRGLLDFAASQQLGMNPENINEVIEATLSLMRHTFSKASVAISKVLLPEPPMVLMDRIKIEQVLVNVFLNAIHAMPEGGCLTVRTLMRVLASHEVSSDYGARGTDRFHAGLRVLVVEVDDTGSGLSSAVQSKLFEPFFTTKPTGQGTGLGLAVSKKILEMHGADISIKNRPEGGVRVTIIFKI